MPEKIGRTFALILVCGSCLGVMLSGCGAGGGSRPRSPALVRDDIEVGVVIVAGKKYLQLRNVSPSGSRIAVPIEAIGYIRDGKSMYNMYGNQRSIAEQSVWSYDAVLVLSPRMIWLHELPQNLSGVLTIDTSSRFDKEMMRQYAKILIHCWDAKVDVKL